MYRRMSELIVRVADLCEAEGRLLRTVVARVGLGISLMVVAALLLAAGAGLVLTAVWLISDQSLGPAWASAITGVITLTLAGGLLAAAKKVAA